MKEYRDRPSLASRSSVPSWVSSVLTSSIELGTPETGYRSVRDPRRNDAMKETHDVFGLCIGCNVVIVRRKSHEYIAHGSSDEVGAETAAGKNLVHFFEDGGNFYIFCATIHV